MGLFYFCKKYGQKLGRKQTIKLLWKFKEITQEKLSLMSYYTEAYKDKHGRFNKEFYDQLNNLKTADYIVTTGIEPLEKFQISPKGEKVFKAFESEDEQTNYAFQLVKTNLDYIARKHGMKPAELLEHEDHQKITDIEKLPERDEENILCPNLKPNKAKYKFIFDDQNTLDWAVSIGIGERKKVEEIKPEDSLPNTQKEMYELLGL